MFNSYTTTFSEQSIEVPTPQQRVASMPYKVTTFRVALCIFQAIISNKERKFIFHSYKYRCDSNFFSLLWLRITPFGNHFVLILSPKASNQTDNGLSIYIMFDNFIKSFFYLTNILVLIYINKNEWE